MSRNERGDMKFGERLRALREQQDISRYRLAFMVYVNPTYIGKLERGQMPPPSSLTIRNLARALKVDEEELLCLACKVPDGLSAMLSNNLSLSRLLLALSSCRLPPEAYQQMLAIVEGAQLKGYNRDYHPCKETEDEQ